MSISLRVLSEQRIGVERACQLLGTDDEHPVHATRVYAAMKHGAKTRSGQRVTLEYARVIGKLVTSVEAIERFIIALNAVEPVVLPATAKQLKRRQKELAAVDAELAAEGI
jgi:hypothetical protein